MDLASVGEMHGADFPSQVEAVVWGEGGGERSHGKVSLGGLHPPGLAVCCEARTGR